jgi:hypothetical protein
MIYRDDDARQPLLMNCKIARQNHYRPDANIIDRCRHAAYTPHSVIFCIHSHKGAFR